MKSKFLSVLIKVSYMLFALFISIALWMFVEITENVLLTRDITIDKENIILKNHELLDSRGLLVSSVMTESITLTFEGTRREITKLSTGQVFIEVDLENIRTTGLTSLRYTDILPDGINNNNLSITGRTASQIIVMIDRPLTREILVEVNYTGGTYSDEFFAETPVAEPRTITVSGPEEIISQISHIVVPIVAERLSTSYTAELGFILVDEYGEELSEDKRNTDTLVFSHELIRVTIPVRQIKTLPLQVVLSHARNTSEANTTWAATPREITVAGDPEDIKDLNSIMLGTIDMTSFGLTATRAFPIILPNNLVNISGETEASVQVDVLGLIAEFRSVPNYQMDTANIPLGYSAVILTQSLDVRLRGSAADLAAVTPENIRIIADLTDFSPGTSWASARATLAGTDVDVDIIGDYRLAVTVTEDNGGIP